MDLGRYVTSVERLLSAAVAGDEAQLAAAERLVAALEPALRLALLDALGVAVSEISRELAPGSVELRLRGGEPEFVVAAPPGEPPPDDGANAPAGVNPVGSDPVVAGDRDMTRVNLRLPESLKARIEAAADRDGLSLNAWLVRAAATAVERAGVPPGPPGPAARRGQRVTGWVQ